MHFLKLAATAPRFLERDLRTVWQYRLEREGLQRILRLQTPLYSYASSYSARYITNASNPRTPAWDAKTHPATAPQSQSRSFATTARILVCRHHKIELLRPKRACFRAFDRLVAHHPRKSSCLCRRRHHVAAIGHVGPAALLIRLQKLCAENFSMLFRDKHFMVGSHPIGQRFVFAHPVAACRSLLPAPLALRAARFRPHPRASPLSQFS
jgi:hypothetical protein